MIRISILAALICCTATMAAAADDLYRAQTVVTGQGEANRIIGFAACLEDVLIKVSGAVKLAGDPRLAAYQSRAGDFVKAHSYHDQMSGTPIRDEQGTRDRPYDLIVDFDERKIDDLLKALGVTPWLSHRPVLAVFVEMEQGARKYIVTADAGLSAVAPRQSLLAAAAKRGRRGGQGLAPVTREELRQQRGHAPAVQHRMVEAQRELKTLLAQAMRRRAAARGPPPRRSSAASRPAARPPGGPPAPAAVAHEGPRLRRARATWRCTRASGWR